MTHEEFLKDLKKVGALQEGHFQLSSGLHSKEYIQCALYLQIPKNAERVAQELAKFVPAGVQAVVSPALGGLLIGHEVAKVLDVRHMFAERVDGVMTLRRGFELMPGEAVVIVEDVFTTGKSTSEVAELVRASGGDPKSAISLVNRSEESLSLNLPTSSLLHFEIKMYEPAKCPLCKDNVPIVKPGSRTPKNAPEKP